MQIDCFISESCSSLDSLKANIKTAIAGLGLEAAVNYRTVGNEEAVGLGLQGSPTVMINGKDIIEGGTSSTTPGIA
jgi:hypothetical protein